jgi:NDP-sugar pyrophosphorylase family protein
LNRPQGKIKQAVILAGGQGRRLLPYTKILPKPLWPVGDVPIVEILLRQLAKAEIKDIIMAVGYQGELMKIILGDGKQFGLKIRYSLENKPLGTAGPLKIIDDLDKSFLVLNGDLLTDLPFDKFIDYHNNTKAPVTVAVFKRTVNVDFGVVIEKGKKIADYIEKPSIGYLVSMGIYAFNREILPLIPNRRFDFPHLVHKLIKQGRNPAVYHHDGKWLDIGRPDDWENADRIYQNNPKLFLR